MTPSELIVTQAHVWLSLGTPGFADGARTSLNVQAKHDGHEALHALRQLLDGARRNRDGWEQLVRDLEDDVEHLALKLDTPADLRL